MIEKRFIVIDAPYENGEPFLYKKMLDKNTKKEYTNSLKGIDDICELSNKLHEENEHLKSRINDLEWVLGIQSDITSVYWGDRNFNCCILDLIGNGRQQSVLNYLYNHYRKNDSEIKRFDNILRENGVKYGKYGWEKER